MTKTQGHSLDTQSPSQINQFSQPLTLDTSEPTTQKHLENFTQNELRHEEAQEIPLDFRNSGFSGDDTLAEPLQPSYQANLLSNNLKENFLRNGDNLLLNDGGNDCNINCEMEGSVASLRYMDRRRRNNEAAKRCRANRRAVFEYRSRRAQLLEAENGELRQEMIKLNNELEQLKALIAANAVAASQESSPSQQNQPLLYSE
uniref:BZIP domain-containing protein n=1 Tax=Meloidogyne javanica TaxID=6303 RepID=A0A915M7V2_MELJA